MPNSKSDKTEKEAQRNPQVVSAGRENALPMPHPKSTKLGPVSAKERAEYLQRRERHLKLEGYITEQYEWCFQRPTDETVNKIWDRLKGQLPEEWDSSKEGILGKYSDTKTGKTEKDYFIKVAKQAFVIVLDTWVTAADNNKRTTYNDVFDSLCRAYSDHYHDDAFLAESARDMSEDSVNNCRRDMLISGVDVNNIYKFALRWSRGKFEGKRNPLFHIVERWERDPSGTLKRHYDTELADPKKCKGRYKILEDFTNLLINDPKYRRREPNHLEIWFAERDTESELDLSTKYEVCLDLPYNEVTLGVESKRLLEIQWDTRLFFDVSAFKDDYSRASKQKLKCQAELMRDYELDLEPRQHPSDTSTNRQSTIKLRRKQLLKQFLDEKVSADDKENENKARTFLELLERYESADQFCNAFKHVNKKILHDKKNGLEPIRSAFHRTRTRRYQPEHLWPVQVTKRDEEVMHGEHRLDDSWANENYRKKWFKAEDPTGDTCDLVGLDISSSQIQIIAALMGIEGLESKSMAGSGEAFKRFLTEIVWKDHESKNEKFSLTTIDEAIRALKKEEDRAKGRGNYELAARIRLQKYRLVDKGDYEGVNDGRLVELVKNLMMRTLYGGNLQNIVWEHRDDPKTYGPGWDYTNAEIFKDHLFFEFPDLKKFLDACANIAQNEGAKAHGAEFTDPLDGERFLWNPVHRADYPYGNGDHKLTLSVPGRSALTGDYEKRGKERQFLIHLDDSDDLDAQILSKFLRLLSQKPDGEGEIEKLESGAEGRWLVECGNNKWLAIRQGAAVEIYKAKETRALERDSLLKGSLPVDDSKLSSMIAPCLVQVLDAYYSSVVMRKLRERGITSFVGIHDCWMVPTKVQTVINGKTQPRDGQDVLKEVMLEADDEWYDGLGPVYEGLLNYLGDHDEYGPFIRCARDKWENRHGKGNPPHFLYAEE